MQYFGSDMLDSKQVAPSLGHWVIVGRGKFNDNVLPGESREFRLFTTR